MSKLKWKTKEGEIIPIDKLSDNHLKNIVAMLKRNRFVHTETAMACLAYACTTGGEMASMAAEQEFYEMKTSQLTDEIFEENDRRSIHLAKD